MRALNLDKKQRKKLLEMAKKLFSEYYWKPVYEGDDVNNQALLNEDNIFEFEVLLKKHKNGDESYSYTEIHWFEFCITHLSHKIIYNPDNPLKACVHNHEGLLQSTMSLFYGEKNGIHPVDYLYEEFLKLK